MKEKVVRMSSDVQNRLDQLAEGNEFRKKLESLLNEYNMEGRSDTPDFILADFLDGCLKVFDESVRKRNDWYCNKLIESRDASSDTNQ
jgi:hypothetical protein